MRRLYILLASVVIATLLIAVAPGASGQPAYDVQISATAPGWQQTPLWLQPGNTFTVSYLSGTWTVDNEQPTTFPYVGPEGYPPDIDSQIQQGCKLVPEWPYALLIGKVGETSSLIPVGTGGTFTASSGGYLYLAIHDTDNCLGDNDGNVNVRVG